MQLFKNINEMVSQIEREVERREAAAGVASVKGTKAEAANARGYAAGLRDAVALMRGAYIGGSIANAVAFEDCIPCPELIGISTPQGLALLDSGGASSTIHAYELSKMSSDPDSAKNIG